jgi:hypothetical protein
MLRHAADRGRAAALEHFKLADMAAPHLAQVHNAVVPPSMPMPALRQKRGPMFQHQAMPEWQQSFMQARHGAGAPPAPATPASPDPAWAAAHAAVRGQQAANVAPAHAELPAPKPAAQSLAPAAAPAAAGAASAAAGGAGRFMRGTRRGLGLAALGTAGALAYGLHNQNEEDRRQRDLVYAPMTGGF